jgi:hypothetical protein
LPPTEVERIRSVSDVSSTSSDTQGEVSRSSSYESTNSAKNSAASEAELSVDSSEGQRVPGLDESASQQLTKLAQIVQQHYGSVDEEQEGDTDGGIKGSIKNV